MAKKKKNNSSPQSTTNTEAKFPYTTKPSSLRKLLKEIPRKPKPSKFDKTLLRSWGFGDTNDLTMLRVMKAVSLLNDRNEPSDLYSQYMNLDAGAKALGPEIRRLYAPLFQASHAPYQESNEKLQNLFNIHSGGGDRSLEYQIQTFKALCENAAFEQGASTTMAGNPLENTKNTGMSGVGAVASGIGGPGISINLHIHLPENKTRRDYEDIIEDIGRYIFGRETGARRE
jgi:hypothetical protein